MRRLCDEGMRSYLGRSRLVPERATVMNRSEKSAKAVIAEVRGRRGRKETVKGQTRGSVKEHGDVKGHASDAGANRAGGERAR